MITKLATGAALALITVLMGCAPQIRNLPTGEGKVRASASFGGPLVDAFGRTVPIPYSVAGVTYGLRARIDLHADLHLTAAAYGFLGFTPGATWYPQLPLGPLVTALGADVMFFSDFDETRAYPQLAVTLTHTRAGALRPYAGVYNTFQFSREPRHIFSPYAGVSRSFGRWQPYLELKWLAAGRDNTMTAVTYHGIGGRGALATQAGVALNLGGGR